MDTAARDVVVLGWWADAQNRIAFIKLLQRERGFGLAEAKTVLDAHLRDGGPIVIPIAPAARANVVALEIETMGAEVCVLSGHLGAADDAGARADLAAIEVALRDFRRRDFNDWRIRARAARELCSALRPQPANRSPS
jgi:hypothetical protein